MKGERNMKLHTTTYQGDISSLYEKMSDSSTILPLENEFQQFDLCYISNPQSFIGDIADLHAGNAYIIPERDSHQQCTGLYIQSEESILHITNNDNSFFNQRYISQQEKVIFLCDTPLLTCAFDVAGAHAIYVDSKKQNQFIKMLKHHDIMSSFVITSSHLNEVKGYFSDEDIISVCCEYDEKEVHMQSVHRVVETAESTIADSRLDYSQKYSSYGNIKQFQDDIHNVDKNRIISTGFHELDEKLNGGIRTGVTFIGAISSLGKTSLVLQMADQMAKNGEDVLIFNAEMPTRELMAKSLSRESYMISKRGKELSDCAKTSQEILSGGMDADNIKNQAFSSEVYNAYSRYADKIYYDECIGEASYDHIESRVIKHIRHRNKKPVIIVDYLQIMEPEKPNMTDKQAVDKNVIKLKKLSNKVDVPIIVISSFNRENYNAPVSVQSFKEAGSIEYSADILIGMQYKGMDEIEEESEKKKKIRELRASNINKQRISEPIELELKILKNRNGTQETLTLEFLSRYSYFSEKAPKKSGGWITC